MWSPPLVASASSMSVLNLSCGKSIFLFIVVVAISIFSTLLNCVHACFCLSFAELFISHCGIHFSEIKGYLLYFGIACAFCVNIFMQSNLASLNNIELCLYPMKSISWAVTGSPEKTSQQ